MIKNILSSFWFWGFALVAFITIILWDDGFEENAKGNYIKHRMTLSNVNVSQIENGFEHSRMYAVNCAMDDSHSNMEASDIKVLFFKEDVATYTGHLISASATKSPFEAKFYGNVRLWDTDNQRMKTEEMNYLFSRKEMTTKKPITIWKDNAVLTGLGMTYNIDNKEITINQQVVTSGVRPMYGQYDEEYRKTVDEVVDKLQSFRGNYVCQEANDFAQRLCDENERLAELYDSEGYLVLSYRATVIAWLKGMVLWLLNGQQWTKVIEDYVRWALRYDLWCKYLIFGEMLEKELSDNNLANHRGPQNLCELLPERFHLKDLENLRVRLGKKGGSAKNLLTKWKARGFVTYESLDGEIVKCSS